MFAYRCFLICYILAYSLLLDAIFFRVWYHGFREMDSELVGLAVAGLVLLAGVATSYMIQQQTNYKRTVNEAYAVWMAEVAKRGHVEDWVLPYDETV